MKCTHPTKSTELTFQLCNARRQIFINLFLESSRKYFLLETEIQLSSLPTPGQGFCVTWAAPEFYPGFSECQPQCPFQGRLTASMEFRSEGEINSSLRTFLHQFLFFFSFFSFFLLSFSLHTHTKQRQFLSLNFLRSKADKSCPKVHCQHLYGPGEVWPEKRLLNSTKDRWGILMLN